MKSTRDGSRFVVHVRSDRFGHVKSAWSAALTTSGTRAFSDGRLTPELVELVKKTFRGVHVLAYLKREELADAGEQDRFGRVAKAAQSAQSETFSRKNPSEDA